LARFCSPHQGLHHSVCIPTEIPSVTRQHPVYVKHKYNDKDVLVLYIYTVPATAVRTSAISTGCLSSCFYASVSVSRPVSKQQKLSAPSISILQFTIMIPCALCYIMMPGALCTTIITITLSISSTGVSTGCLSSNYLSATDSGRYSTRRVR